MVINKNMAALLAQGRCVVEEAVSKQSAVLLFLHGLGDTGHGWASILKDTRPGHVKVMCPTASIMPVTVNNGHQMPSWFDIYTLNKGDREDEDGIRKAAKDVHDALDALKDSGTPTDRIVLGGFSQGGSVAAFAGLTYRYPLAGIVLMSCWVPLWTKLEKEALEVNKNIPILHCHGDYDQVVQYKFGEMSRDFLQSIKCTNHMFKQYHGLGHSSSIEEMNDLQEWMGNVLKPSGGSI